MYLQRFDSLAESGTGNVWADNLTLLGWYASKTAAPNDVTTYSAGPGSSITGALYSFGESGSSERALGSVASGGVGNLAYGVCFVNDTGVPQTDFRISFTGEQWRVAASAVQTLAFSYQVGAALTNADAQNSQSWVPFPALDFASPNTNPTQALNGNDPANQVVFTNVLLPGIVLQPGAELFLRWFDEDDSGSDDGLGIDNLTVSFAAAGTNAAPSSPAFSLLQYNTHGNDVADWSTNSQQVQAIGRQLLYLKPDIATLNEIPYTNTYQMANWVRAFLPGYYLATNSATDGYIRSAIASRFPIIRSKSWLHSSNLDPYGYTNSNFTRDLFEAVIAVPGFPQPLHVFAVHLKAGQDATSTAKRAAEASAISNFFVTAYLTTNSLQPYVVSGDMNEDIVRPPASDAGSVQRLTGAPTGLHLTTPLNPFTGSELTFSIRSASLSKRYDYILPSSLLFSNIVSSQVFRTDELSGPPPPLLTTDDQTASDHLPVFMVFGNPYDIPFAVTAEVNTGQVSLRWNSVPGQMYRVEGSSDLTNWEGIADNLLATNSTYTVTTNEPADMDFFRVRRLP